MTVPRMTTDKQEMMHSPSSPEQIISPSAVSAAGAQPRSLRRILALDDFEDAARRVIPRPIFGYVTGGAETNASLRANRAVWNEIEFVPKVLVDTSGRTHKTTLFGYTYDAPFGIAPMGGSGMAAYQGDLVLARAAAAAPSRGERSRRSRNARYPRSRAPGCRFAAPRRRECPCAG